MVMSFLGGLAGGALGLVGSIFGAKQQQSYNVQNMATQAKYNTQEMKYANDLNKELALYNQGLTLQNLQSTPYALRQGMEYAGFNPILAYSSGNFSNASQSGSSPALGSSLPSSPKLDYSSSLTSAFNKGLAIQQQLNANKLNEAQVNNVNADTVIKQQEANMNLDRQEQLWIDNERRRIDNAYRRKELNYFEKEYELRKLNSHAQNVSARALERNAEASIRNSETNADKLLIDLYNAETNRGRRSTEFHGFGFGVNRTRYTKKHD